MGWPTKGSGKSYNSNTGFGAFCGGYTNGVIISRVLCRRCRVCEIAKRKHTPPQMHDCIQNYSSEASSKGMEPLAILEMAVEAPTRGFVMDWIVSDDDSVMRAHLKHNKGGGTKDKGKLPIWICEPDFMADPGHRKKVVASKFYKLAMAPVAVSRVTSAMAKRLKKNWGYMIRQGKHLENVDEFTLMAKAVVEHMFNNHAYCGEWCLARKAKEEKKVYVPPTGWLSCDVEREKKIHEQLSAIVDVYGGPFYLRQSMHHFTTQTNEALNQSQAMLTPKAKVFHESRSFHYRHAIVIGCHNWGVRKYWTSVFTQLGIAHTSHLISYLDIMDTKRKSKRHSIRM